MYESNYSHNLIEGGRSEEIEVAVLPTVQGEKLRKEGEKDDMSDGKRQRSVPRDFRCLFCQSKSKL